MREVKVQMTIKSADPEQVTGIELFAHAAFYQNGKRQKGNKSKLQSEKLKSKW